MNKQSTLLLLAGLLSGATLTYLVLRPAQIHHARVTSFSLNHPRRAHVMWSYSPGLRPVSLIIDIVAGNGAHGSLTTGGETLTGMIPMSTDFRGTYTLTGTATYRILGRYRTITWTTTGTV